MWFNKAVCLVLLGLATQSLASSGDRSGEFQICLTQCSVQNRCTASSGSELALPLRLTRWTCYDDCKYNCMHSITDEAIQQDQPIQQYYGKWPFWRLAGMQEPASVAFSLLNLWAYARGAREVKRRIPDGHPMKSYYLIWSFVSMNAWVWSSVFHTRDLPITEKLDYFSAALAIGYGLYYTVIRFFHLYPRRDTDPESSKRSLHLFWTTLCGLIFLAHISYLSLLPRFDYAYNMTFNLTVGLSHNALWILYSLPSSLTLLRRFPSKPKSYRPSYASRAALFVLLTTAATALELFDFAPWGRIIDAHSLWHLSTAPIALYWYRFLVEDALDEGWRGLKV